MTQSDLLIAIKRAREVWVCAHVTLDDPYWFQVSKRVALRMVTEVRKRDGYRAVLEDRVLSLGN